MTLAIERPGERSPGWRHAAMALGASLLLVLLAASKGFPTLFDSGADNDSLLRLVEVRDLIAGQGWFDLQQYRMGLEGGFTMHWSRLVDAPIAVIVLAASAVTGSVTSGESVAMVLWPLLLYAAALWLLLAIAWRLGGDEATFPTLLIGAVTLHFTGIFVPGTLDHHNIQLVLMLATLLFLLDAAQAARAAWWAGVSAVLMLAVGMETAPFVAAAGLFVAGWLLFDGERAAGPAFGFGLAFAATSALVLGVTVPPSAWGVVACDAYSLPQSSLGIVAGLGLAAIAAMPVLRRSFAARAAAIVVLGAVAASVAVLSFPQCLADPYAGLDPILKDYWLDSVAEAQPLWRVITLDTESAAAHYMTPLIGLAVMVLAMLRRGLRRGELLVALFLLVAFAVSAWQLRGSRFSVPLAVIPLAIWVAGWRRRAVSQPGTAASLRLVGAWLVSLNLTWIMLGVAGMWALSPADADASGAGAAAALSKCQKSDDYAELAGMPPQPILVISNLGAPMLRHTPHRVLTGPYHRNVDGNLAALRAFVGPVAAADDIARSNGITLVALCRGNGETRALAGRAPDGLLAALVAGKAPGWLEAVPESLGRPIELYRIRNAP
ncbi:MAG: GtrA family protein [Alphaproteobacteria bacterium]|nr:GtrA family protein [Alphaproteobacteria bacterium]